MKIAIFFTADCRLFLNHKYLQDLLFLGGLGGLRGLPSTDDAIFEAEGPMVFSLGRNSGLGSEFFTQS
jgi:hypothetical protein